MFSLWYVFNLFFFLHVYSKNCGHVFLPNDIITSGCLCFFLVIFSGNSENINCSLTATHIILTQFIASALQQYVPSFAKHSLTAK